MLTSFRVENCRNFKRLEYNLNSIGNYEFDYDSVHKNVCKTGLIYGANGSGKTNLGKAIADIIIHISDNPHSDLSRETNAYLNATTSDSEATFLYNFQFDKGNIEYYYKKKSPTQLTYESLKINDVLFIEYRHKSDSELIANFANASTLNRHLSENVISAVKYTYNNIALGSSCEEALFRDFYEFVQGMLVLKSISNTKSVEPIGAMPARNTPGITNWIIEQNLVSDFESYLNKSEVSCKLVVKEDGEGVQQLYFDFGSKQILFKNNASSGTLSLASFYMLLKSFSNLSFIYLDEYDAFYHFKLAQEVYNACKNDKIQVLLSTHNTNLIEAGYTRPDCIFQLLDNQIYSFAQCSGDRELRKAHNLGKLYRGGAFSHSDDAT